MAESTDEKIERVFDEHEKKVAEKKAKDQPEAQPEATNLGDFEPDFAELDPDFSDLDDINSSSDFYSTLPTGGPSRDPEFDDFEEFYQTPPEVPASNRREEPEAVEPEAVEPEAVEPEAVEPEAVAPEAVEPEAVEPEAVAPEAVEPEAVEPEAVEPEAVAPEAVEPEAVAPEAAEPEDVVSEAEEPKTSISKEAGPEAVGTARPMGNPEAKTTYKKRIWSSENVMQAGDEETTGNIHKSSPVIEHQKYLLALEEFSKDKYNHYFKAYLEELARLNEIDESSDAEKLSDLDIAIRYGDLETLEKVCPAAVTIAKNRTQNDYDAWSIMNDAGLSIAEIDGVDENFYNDVQIMAAFEDTFPDENTPSLVERIRERKDAIIEASKSDKAKFAMATLSIGLAASVGSAALPIAAGLYVGKLMSNGGVQKLMNKIDKKVTNFLVDKGIVEEKASSRTKFLGDKMKEIMDSKLGKAAMITAGVATLSVGAFSLMDANGFGWSEAKNAVAGLSEQVSQFTDNAMMVSGEIMEKASDATGNVVSNISEFSDYVATNTSDFVSEAAIVSTNSLGDVFESASEFSGDAANFARNIPHAGESLYDFLEGAESAASHASYGLREMGMDMSMEAYAETPNAESGPVDISYRAPDDTLLVDALREADMEVPPVASETSDGYSEANNENTTSSNTESNNKSARERWDDRHHISDGPTTSSMESSDDRANSFINSLGGEPDPSNTNTGSPGDSKPEAPETTPRSENGIYNFESSNERTNMFLQEHGAEPLPEKGTVVPSETPAKPEPVTFEVSSGDSAWKLVSDHYESQIGEKPSPQQVVAMINDLGLSDPNSLQVGQTITFENDLSKYAGVDYIAEKDATWLQDSTSNPEPNPSDLPPPKAAVEAAQIAEAAFIESATEQVNHPLADRDKMIDGIHNDPEVFRDNIFKDLDPAVTGEERIYSYNGNLDQAIMNKAYPDGVPEYLNRDAFLDAVKEANPKLEVMDTSDKFSTTITFPSFSETQEMTVISENEENLSKKHSETAMDKFASRFADNDYEHSLDY